MKTFAQKVADARHARSLSQMELAELVGVSDRSIKSYEKGTIPRASTLAKLARALQVSVTYLTNDNCDDPQADIEKGSYVAEARSKYGAEGARDVDQLLAANKALFAGGELSEEQKDVFFAAVTAAYMTCKEEAKKKFTPKNKSKVQ